MAQTKDESYWRRLAHDNFDPIWSEGWLSRNQAYVWMRQQLNLTGEIHIKYFTPEQCSKLIEASRDFLSNAEVNVTRWNKKREKGQRRAERQFAKICARRGRNP